MEEYENNLRNSLLSWLKEERNTMIADKKLFEEYEYLLDDEDIDNDKPNYLDSLLCCKVK